MSIVSTNPANQDANQGASGGQIFVPISGTLPVTIVGSVGGTTFTDVNSSITSDTVSTGTDCLTTQGFLYGYHQSGDTFVRLRATVPICGRVFAPESGYSLQTCTMISDWDGIVANVMSNQDDDVDPMSGDNSHSLNTAAKLYGFNQMSGADSFARIRAVRLNQTQSGAVFSGYGLLTAGIIIDEGGKIANVAETDDDNESTQPALTTMSKTYGMYRASGQWGRISTAYTSGDALGDDRYSGHSLVVSIGDKGYLAHTTPTLTHGENAQNSLFTAAFVMGNDPDTSDWYKIGAKSNSDGADGMSLEVSDTPIAANIDSSRVTITNLSGGTVLPTVGVLGDVYIQNESGNNVMNVAGNNAGDFPHSTQGFQLFGGESMILKVTSTDVIAVWAATSGQRIRLLSTN